MRGIRSFSSSLSQHIDSLPVDALPNVVIKAFETVAGDFVDDGRVVEAIGAVLNGRFFDQRLANAMKQASAEFDAIYSEYQDNGDERLASFYFWRMCVCNALVQILSSPDLTLTVVDAALYDLSFAVADHQQFASRLSERLGV